MADIYVSSPGKVILHGEHAVVYGKKALAASLNIRTFLRLRPTIGQVIHLVLPDIGVNATFDRIELQKSLQLPLCPARSPVPPTELVMEQLRQIAGLSTDNTDTKCLAIIAFLYLFSSITPKDGELPSVSLLLSSNLPCSAGLGSSAAYSTCLAASLLELAGFIALPPGASYSHEDLKLINDWAFQSEKVIHGNPSGIDNSVSTYGGAISFQGGKISPLAKVPTLEILLTNTKVPRSTKVLVAGVREKYNKYPEIIEPVINSIEAICNKCEEVFSGMNPESTEKDYQILKDLIVMNQQHLSVLGVSHPSLDTICRITSSRGLWSKLTGAGGGGCAFTLIPPGTDVSAVEDIKKALEADNYSCWQTVIGGAGVTRHFELHPSMTLPKNFILT